MILRISQKLSIFFKKKFGNSIAEYKLGAEAGHYLLFSRRISVKNESVYYSGKFFFFFFRQIAECMRSGHFLQNY